MYPRIAAAPRRVPGSCGLINDPDRKHFHDMWKLVKQASLSVPFFRETWKVFTDELIIAIFWEESTFRNRPQHSNSCKQIGPAFGFGQIEPGGFGPYKALTKNKPPVNRIQDVIGNDLLSAQMTMRMLHYIYTENPGHRNKLQALKGYGSVFQFPQRIGVINNWLACERLLRQPKRIHRNADKYWLPPRADVERALVAAAPQQAAFLPEVLAGMP